MLKTKSAKYYQVKSGQSLEEIAAYFSVSPYLLAAQNRLRTPPFAGQLLEIPVERGNGYTVQEGDEKELLCGGKEGYLRRNGTEVFYVGMRVII